MGLVTDDDYTLGAIDYSKDKIQTSNKSDLSDAIVKREKELEKLNQTFGNAQNIENIVHFLYF